MMGKGKPVPSLNQEEKQGTETVLKFHQRINTPETLISDPNTRIHNNKFIFLVSPFDIQYVISKIENLCIGWMRISVYNSLPGIAYYFNCALSNIPEQCICTLVPRRR